MRYLAMGASLVLFSTMSAAAVYAASVPANTHNGGSAVQKAAYECAFVAGEEQCRWVPEVRYYNPNVVYPGRPYDYDDDRPLSAEDLPPGSHVWWDQMGRERGSQ
jgi:hypothetical protein